MEIEPDGQQFLDARDGEQGADPGGPSASTSRSSGGGSRMTVVVVAVVVAVLVAGGVAVAALVMCLGFVMANSPGYPWKWWRLTPGIGLLNWPNSMLAWDVIMLNGYLVLNLTIPFYILYQHYTGREPSKKKYLPFIYISVIWAVSIHLVTAFLFAGLPARPGLARARSARRAEAVHRLATVEG